MILQPFKIKINAWEQTPLKSRVMGTLPNICNAFHEKNVNGFELPILEEKKTTFLNSGLYISLLHLLYFVSHELIYYNQVSPCRRSLCSYIFQVLWVHGLYVVYI